MTTFDYDKERLQHDVICVQEFLEECIGVLGLMSDNARAANLPNLVQHFERSSDECARSLKDLDGQG